MKIMKNKKAVIENFIEILLWIVVLILLGIGAYFLVRYFTSS